MGFTVTEQRIIGHHHRKIDKKKENIYDRGEKDMISKLMEKKK